jgi:hypothetical protein
MRCLDDEQNDLQSLRELLCLCMVEALVEGQQNAYRYVQDLLQHIIEAALTKTNKPLINKC